MHSLTSGGRLEGSRVLITGASSGVGAAAVALFAGEGARLALLSRSEQALGEVAAEHAPDALVVPVDLTDREATHKAVEHVCAELGGIDILVSNHAAAVFGHVLEVHPDDFDRTLAVTFGGAVNVIRSALPELRRSRGTIVATGSLMARVPLPTWSSYTAAKHALRGFLNSLSIEEREQGSGVRVAMVHPGPIDTPLFAQSSSATGLKPRIPPDAYTAQTVARALLEVAVDPRDEVVLGGETRIMDVMFRVARPIAETMLVGIDRWYRSGDEPSMAPGSLWEAPGPTQERGGIPSRESLMAPLQLGRRMLPGPRTPFRLARNLGLAGIRAGQLASTLRHTMPETPPARAPERATPAPAQRRSRGRVTV